VPLAMLWCVCLVRCASGTASWIQFGGFGFFTGGLLLLQPLALMPISAASFAVFRYRLKPLVLIGLCALLPMSVWITRNFLAFEKFIPTKSMLYGSMYMGWLPEFAPDKKFDVIDEKTKRQIDSLRKVLNDVELEAPHKAAVLETIQTYPMLYLEKTLRQAALFWWIPPRYAGDLSLGFIAVRLLPVILLNALCAVGIFRLWKIHSTFAVSIALALAYFTAVYALTQISNIRFKLDIEWLELYACAAAISKHNRQ
jgi:hypothetical protein